MVVALTELAKIITIKVDHNLNSSEVFSFLEKELTECSLRGRSARVLFEIPEDYQGWKFIALWENLTSQSGIPNAIEKLAIVGGSEWIHWGADISTLLPSGNARNFKYGDSSQAEIWLQKD